MKNIYVSLTAFSTLLLLSFSSSDNTLDKIIAGFTKYLEVLPQEKVYLHFDRPYYTSGETIWFKAYLTAGTLHEPSPFSRTVYVELINDQGKLVNQVKLLSIDGVVAGDIVLADSLSSGSYLVRAYTNWMKNGEEDYFFHRPVKIWNTDDEISDGISVADVLDVQFFPEGGDLVAGIPSKVAFKATGADGLGRSVKGKIVTATGETAVEFQSNFLGMGAANLIPQKGQSYRAIIEGQTTDYRLPVVKESGLTLSVKTTPQASDIFLRVQTTDFAQLKTIYLLAQVRGIVCSAARIDLTSNAVMTKIPKSNFPAGVAQITVTDYQGNPLAERLVYVNPETQLTFDIVPDKSTYAPRELVTLDILAKDAKGKPVAGDFSLAVCDDQQVLLDENRETIASYLMLSSELRGHIESPGYYFNPANEGREEALDHLLLTQGWRRFTLKNAVDATWNGAIYPMEKGLTIKGIMVDKYTDKPVVDGKVSYLAFDPIPDSREVRTDASGNFVMDNIVYFDTAHAVLQGETKKGNKHVKVITDNSMDFLPTTFPLMPLSQTQNEFERAFIARSSELKKIDYAYDFEGKTVLMNEIKILGMREKRPEKMNRFYGDGSVMMKASDNRSVESLTHPLQLVQGRVAGVSITGSGLDWRVQIQGAGSIQSGTTPLFLVDDIPVDIEGLHMIPVLDIETFVVWKGPDAAVFGSRGANGAIGFYTKLGSSYVRPSEGVFAFGNTGYQIEREFYAPKYDVAQPEHIKPDKRVTLHWEPLVQTDSTGRAKVMFYNHDLETTVTGTMEGMSITGIPGTASFKYAIGRK